MEYAGNLDVRKINIAFCNTIFSSVDVGAVGVRTIMYSGCEMILHRSLEATRHLPLPFPLLFQYKVYSEV